MALHAPSLDDRTFEQLVEEARALVARRCPQWTDLTPGDPGMMLLELFAHLTETMLYRLNRLPEKAYVEFLRLMGVTIQPPSAAAVTLRFSAARPPERPIEIPGGTAVTTAGGGGEPPVFLTMRAVTLTPAKPTADVLAHHCEQVEGEDAGRGTGQPGQSIRVRRPPIVAPTGHELDLVVAVEALPAELSSGVAARKLGEKAYRIWRETERFTNLGADRHVYTVDRVTGTITFAPAARMRDAGGTIAAVPAALAEVPGADREIRVWYRRGGGANGNLAAGRLTVVRQPVPGAPGLAVTNPSAATGGRAAETMENALVRGPQELHSLQRAVTARDFELLALRSGGAVARAKAFTKAALWTHAPAGTVEVLLVPDVREDKRARLAAATLAEHQTDEARRQIQEALDERKPLGTSCRVNWVRTKTVSVGARVFVHGEEDPKEVRQRVEQRLHQTINPLPIAGSGGWRFGQALHASTIYDILLKEPGVSHADEVELRVDEVPDRAVEALAADAFQPDTWFASGGGIVYRSMNDGVGWETAGRFGSEQVTRVAVHPRRAGLVAVVTTADTAARVHLSRDCGETWERAAETSFPIEDLAWMTREGTAVLLLATGAGLFELSTRPGSSPLPIQIDPARRDHALYAVTAVADEQGIVSVAVALQKTGGVYLSVGYPKEPFVAIGLAGEDARNLAVQHVGGRDRLWAGLYAAGTDPGRGCLLWELGASRDQAWQEFPGWKGGSCYSIAFQGRHVCGASHEAGVLRLDAIASKPSWDAPAFKCGLPIRDQGRLQPVKSVAADPDGGLILAGGPEGVFRSTDGATYVSCSARVLRDKVTLPETWLFCSGDHAIEVERRREAE